MRTTPYYSVRTGNHPTGGRLDLPMLRQFLVDTYNQLEYKGYFQQYFGYECVDQGFVEGIVGRDAARYVFRKLRKEELWPIGIPTLSANEEDVFDLIEFLFDHAAKGVQGGYHQFAGCGWHYTTFDASAGQRDFRDAINDGLREYSTGYQLSSSGEVIKLAPSGMAELEAASIPDIDKPNISDRIESAISKFRRRGAEWQDRRDAVRDLIDIVEFLRPHAKEHLISQDESDLFELANRFGIRHHNQTQKISYDRDLWLSWMFYYHLASIHALTRMIERDNIPDSDDRSTTRR
jgi:hypothetical protein